MNMRCNLACRTRLRCLLAVFGAIVALGALALAFWLQFVSGWEPCALCWLQRGALFLLATGFLYHVFTRRNPWGLHIAFIAAIGGLAAAWIQHGEVSTQSNTCLLQFNGAMLNCGEAGAHVFLGVTLVDWALLLFGVLLILAILIEGIGYFRRDSNA